MTEPQFNSDSTDYPLSRTMTSMPDIEMSLSHLASYFESMQAQIQRLSDENVTLKDQNQSLNLAIFTLNDNKHNVERELTDAKDEIACLNRKIEDLQLDLDNANDEIDRRNQEPAKDSPDCEPLEDWLTKQDDRNVNH